MSEPHGNYNPNSLEATVSRVEAKLDITLQGLDKHGTAIDGLWKAVGSLKSQVIMIATGISVVIGIIKLVWGHSL